MDNTEILTVLSLCTGYGGLELGLSGALENPLRVVAVEVEAYALANLVAKAEEGKLAIEALWPDLRTFPAERFRGCFDFILAGYPCQPFSCAGQRKGTEDPRHLWPYIARIIEAVEPLWCFFENVSGHVNLGFADVYCKLRDMGYKVEAGLFTAAEVGAPHRRERLFILAKSRCRQQRQRSHTEQVPDERNREARPANSISRPSSGQLADTTRSNTECERQFGNDLSLQGGTRWPARPGQPQYEWEEPRVVVHTRGPESTGLSSSERQEVSEVGRTSKLGDASSDIQGRQQRELRKTAGKGTKIAGQSRQVRDNTGGSSEQGQAESSVDRAAYGSVRELDEVAERMGAGYCAKVTTIATIITATGEKIVGFNACRNPQEECPRNPGEGYGKCLVICEQIGHAEAVACMLADGRANGGKLYLQGHTYCCDACLRTMKQAGIKRWYILPIDPDFNRVDRLRLLGNGVVPQQAAKAFKYLSDLSVLCRTPLESNKNGYSLSTIKSKFLRRAGRGDLPADRGPLPVP